MSTPTNLQKEYLVMLRIAVERKDYVEYLKCYTKIEDLAEKGKPIPAKLFRQWTQYMADYTTVEAMERVEQIIPHTRYKEHILQVDHIEEFFGKLKGYNFEETYTTNRKIDWKATLATMFPRPQNIPSEQPAFRILSLQNLIQEAVLIYISQDPPINDKDEAIRFFFEQVNIYIGQLNPENKALFKGDYKKRIIAGYLANIMQWQLIDPSKKLTTKELFQATRNAFRPKKRTKK